MNKQKIFFLVTLIFLRVHGTVEITPESTQAEKIERLKKFGSAVWTEMQKQPDAFINGFTLGILGHALFSRNYTESTIGQLTDSKPLENQKGQLESLQRTSQQLILHEVLTNHIDLLNATYNALLARKINTCTPPTWAQVIPHLALTSAMLAYHNYKEDLFSTSQDIVAKDPLVVYTARAANVLTGATTAYIALSMVNALLKP